MEMKKWRIFLSYRGETDGESFCQDLYDSITSHPNYINKYGEVYFSPVTGKGRNYILDIHLIMEHVEEFVIPLTQDYFKDFWDEKRRCPNTASPTYLEIKAAIDRKAHFNLVYWPDYEPSHELMWLFNEDAMLIDRAIRLKYTDSDKLKIIKDVKQQIKRPDYDKKIRSISELLNGITPNVFLTRKGETEHKEKFPFDEKLHGANKIYMLNFAGTSFISTTDIADVYRENSWLNRWFFENLQLGKVQAQVILTDPHSTAAEDAAKYKMYPEGLTSKSYPEVINPLDVIELKRFSLSLLIAD